ncbi:MULTISPECIES: PaaI family thioesterase [Amycolatopsis]|uniref:PaaI family thioesterase n=1 Tax=Amycolatopsis TaxID=1813 RepID=UPI0033B23AE9
MNDNRTSRVLTWTDPAEVVAGIAELDGIDAMRALRDGELPAPPIAHTMNFTPVEVDHGRVVFTCTPGAEHYNPLGVVHGGLACTLLDTVAGCAAHTTLKAGQRYTSIEITVKYLRPITLDTGPLTATGVVTKAGSRVIFADAEIRDRSAKVVATGSSSLLVW